MGRRGNSAKFQPGYYVFPGGVKERWDNSTNFINHLNKKSIKDMGVSNNQSKAHALAMTAIREAYEEVGLVFGIQTHKTQKIVNKNWRFFHENNIYPDLGALEYLGRATPSLPSNSISCKILFNCFRASFLYRRSRRRT